MALRMSAIFFLVVLVGTGDTRRVRDNVGDVVLQGSKATSTTPTMLNRDGCYFLAEGMNPDFQIRAELTWNSKPKDLELWMTKVECSENTRKRHKCFNNFDREKIAAKESGNHDFDDSCQRSKFSTLDNQFEYRNIEALSCRVMMCDQSDEKYPVGAVTKVDKNGKPICGQFDPLYKRTDKKESPAKKVGLLNNQFAKWVTGFSRYMDRMDQLFDINSGHLGPAEGARGWTENNYAYKDVDARNGYGPETITVVNPPPGTYQFVVHQFKGSPDESPQLKSGNATITVRIGAGESGAEFKCKIEPECPDISYVWNALHIKIESLGWKEELGKEMFKFRIIDSKDKMTRIASDQLPTTNNAEKVETWVSAEEAQKHPGYRQLAQSVKAANPGQKIPILTSYFKNFAGKDGRPYADDEDLDTLCHGKCEVAPTTPGFESCLRDD